MKVNFTFVLVMFCFIASAQKIIVKNNVWYTDLNRALNVAESVYHLDLSNQNLTEIPAPIGRLKNLESLVLSNNQIKTIGASLKKLKHLVAIELNNNQISHLDMHSFEGSKESLEELYIRENQITGLRIGLNDFTRIDILDLGQNKIEEVHSGIQLPNLKWLMLDDNLLKEVPSFALKAKKIKTLNLNGNLIKQFNLAEISNRVERIDIGDNPIDQLVLRSDYKKLETLILDWINLSNFDFNTLPRKLEVLSLERCQLTEVPQAIHGLKKLNQLSLMHNEIEMLDLELQSFPKIKKCWVGGNPLDEVSIEFIASQPSLFNLNH